MHKDAYADADADDDFEEDDEAEAAAIESGEVHDRFRTFFAMAKAIGILDEVVKRSQAYIEQ